jgi:cytochrome c oxidase subunit 4
MSASATAPSAAPADHGHEGKFHVFVSLAMTLAIITGGELLIIYLPLPAWFIITGLMGLSLVKFVAVVWIFMHLKWDKAFNTILLMMGMIIAGGTMWALLLLHGAKASVPVGPAYEELG